MSFDHEKWRNTLAMRGLVTDDAKLEQVLRLMEKIHDDALKEARAEDVASKIVKSLVERCADLGVDWEPELPKKEAFTSREVVDAIGRALKKAGIPNNLERP